MKPLNPFARRNGWLRIGLLCGAIPAVPLAEAQTLHLQGTVEYTSFKNDDSGSISFQHHDHFRITIHTAGQWQMRYDTTGFKDGYFESAFDGTESTRVMYTSRHRDEDGKEIAAFSFEKGNHPATVSKGPYLFDGWPGERFVWFALGAGSYLKSADASQMPAIWAAPRHDPVAHAGFSNTVKMATGQFSFPAAAESITRRASTLTPAQEPSGLVVPHTEGAFQMQKERRDLLKRFEPGHVAARYTVMTSSSVNGQMVPTTFRLEVLWPGRGLMTDSPRIAERFSGVVTNIKSGAEPLAKVEIVGQLTVNDYRFNYQDDKTAVDAIRYRITDGKWKAADDPELLSRFAATKKAVAPFKPASSSARNVPVYLLLFFCISSAVALGLLIWRHRISPGERPVS